MVENNSTEKKRNYILFDSSCDYDRTNEFIFHSQTYLMMPHLMRTTFRIKTLRKRVKASSYIIIIIVTLFHF